MPNKANEYKWQRVGENRAVEHIDSKKDTCFFLMNYEPGVSYKDSKANDRISNFKAYGRSSFDDTQKPHREKACQQFADDLGVPISQILGDASVDTIGLTFIPPSKSKNSPEYDNRFEVVCRQLESRFKPGLSFMVPVTAKVDRAPASQVSARRGSRYVEESKAGLLWQGFSGSPPGVLVVIDDVVTSGGQFRAFSDLIAENSPQPVVIIGLFWAIAASRTQLD